jgi:hypothetical protein
MVVASRQSADALFGCGRDTQSIRLNHLPPLITWVPPRQL